MNSFLNLILNSVPTRLPVLFAEISFKYYQPKTETKTNKTLDNEINDAKILLCRQRNALKLKIPQEKKSSKQTNERTNERTRSLTI